MKGNLRIQRRNSMTPFKLLSAGLIAAALLAATEVRSETLAEIDRSRSGGEYRGVRSSTELTGSVLPNRSDRYIDASKPRDGFYGRSIRHCYFPAEWLKMPPWPPFCD